MGSLMQDYAHEEKLFTAANIILIIVTIGVIFIDKFFSWFLNKCPKIKQFIEFVDED